MILHQHKAAQLWSKMATDPGRQRRDYRPAVGGHPTFAPITNDLRTDHQVLNKVILIALEARAGRHVGGHVSGQDTVFDGDPQRWLLAAPGATSRTLRLMRRRLLHAARV